MNIFFSQLSQCWSQPKPWQNVVVTIFGIILSFLSFFLGHKVFSHRRLSYGPKVLHGLLNHKYFRIPPIKCFWWPAFTNTMLYWRWQHLKSPMHAYMGARTPIGVRRIYWATKQKQKSLNEDVAYSKQQETIFHLDREESNQVTIILYLLYTVQIYLVCFIPY